MWESFTTCPCRAVCSPSKKNGASAGNINPSDWLGRMLICNDCEGVAESKIISDIGANSTVASACPESNSTPDTFAANVRGRPNTTPASPSMVNDRDVNLPGVARCSDQRHAEASPPTFLRASARDSAHVYNVRPIVPGVAQPPYQRPDPATPKTQGPIRSRTISRQQQYDNRSSRSHHQPLAPHLYLPPANRRLTSNWSLLTASFGSSTRPLKFTFKTTRPLS